MIEFELRGKVMLRKPLQALKLIRKHGWEIFDEDISQHAGRHIHAIISFRQALSA